MSGGYFDRNIYAIGEIVASIERDIARALRPKPEKIHKDYWTIYVKDSFLLTDKTIVKAEQKYSDQHFFAEGIIFQSTKRYMSDTYDGERIPVLYSIHHCYYDRYPDDADVLELTDGTVEAMKEAYKQIRIAEIYATRIDWVMSGDDGEDTLQERLNEELEAFEKEFQTKDWTCSYGDEED